MYEWDENKNKLNLEKHGISFDIAIEVFSDPHALVQSNRKIKEELRSQIIGQIEGETVILFVIFTHQKHKIRIISARKANKKERNLYARQNEKRAN